MEAKHLVRIGAFAFAGVALTLAAVELRRPAPPPAGAAASPRAAPADPLAPVLRRCAELGTAAADDPGCLAAWAENRRRFLAPGARPAERLSEPGNGVEPR